MVKVAAVKRETEDLSDEAHGLAHKRSKMEQWGAGPSMAASQPMPYILLDEPSPLGLHLRKSPSFLDLIQTRISQASSAAKSCITSCENSEDKKKSAAVSVTTDKMKASNFPASLLRIGAWECVSKHEGDLVAKCYFAKHKLVWEVLEGGLKSKIEIQWSDISALKATCPESGPSTLNLVLARQPLFFRETNLQPRKHTLWQATEDFTGGQASIYRRHFLQCPQGLLCKHFEKLIQCDLRLNSLSQQPDIILVSPYFEPRCSAFEDQDESKSGGFTNVDDDYESKILGSCELGSPSGASLTSTKSESRDPVGRSSCLMAKETPSPCSANDGKASSELELKEHSFQDQFKFPRLRASISTSDLVNHIGHCISEQMNPGNSHLSSDALPNKSVLEEITQYLFSESQISASGEQSLMPRVNSFCSLLQKDSSAVQSLQANGADSESDDDDDDDKPVLTPRSKSEMKTVLDTPNNLECCDASTSKQQASISRKDSFGDLLLHLPRIASLPQFLFNITEESENQAR